VKARRAPTRAVLFAAAAAYAALATGCSVRTGPPRVDFGVPCGACGMPVRDPRFACVQGDRAKRTQYDAIECLLRDGSPRPGERIYLSDYDLPALHAADSMWVVKGEFPSPMGGGLAALLSRAGAEQIATETRGRVGRLADFAVGPTQ
jgi:nitrous oxide reductase accessory protein NosL